MEAFETDFLPLAVACDISITACGVILPATIAADEMLPALVGMVAVHEDAFSHSPSVPVEYSLIARLPRQSTHPICFS